MVEPFQRQKKPYFQFQQSPPIHIHEQLL
jgi:hypothetical protein